MECPHIQRKRADDETYDICELNTKPCLIEHGHYECETWNEIAVDFAEGKKAGIREVVEWISQHIDLVVFPDNKFYDAWQSKLKDWGIVC